MQVPASWSIQEIEQLFKLTEEDELSPVQLERAAQVAPLQPSRETWRVAIDRLFAFGGALLLGSAVVFFFAYNWAELHHFAKFGVAIAAMAACVGAAVVSPPFGAAYRAALLGACIMTGALLALVGQTYQTGADIWELFAAWAALMLLFVALARSSASWALWIVIANLALSRAFTQSPGSVVLGDWFGPVSVLLVAGLNLALLAFFEALGPRLLEVPRRHLARLAAAGALLPLAAGATVGWWGGEFVVVTLVFIGAALLALKFYFSVRRDLVALGLIVFSFLGVATVGIYRVGIELAQRGDQDSLLFQLVMTMLYPLIALFLIGGSVWAARWLRGLQHEDESA